MDAAHGGGGGSRLPRNSRHDRRRRADAGCKIAGAAAPHRRAGEAKVRFGIEPPMNCEIEFLPVGDGCKPGDAVVIRYGDVQAYELMVIDGGNLDSGKEIVSHVRNAFGKDAVIAHAVVTHPDADHATGL